MNNEIENLKPCPFCGGEAKQSTAMDFYFIECANCLAKPFLEDCEIVAAEKWNARAGEHG